MVPHVPASTRAPAVLAAALALVGGAVALAPASTAHPASAAHPAARSAQPAHTASSSVTLAPGISLTHTSTWISGAAEQMTLLRLNLTVRGVQLDSDSPNGMIDSQRRTVRWQVNRRHAIAGVNADFFDLANMNASPRGVLVTSGRILKSPTDNRNADLVVRKGKHGTSASVGPLHFTGQIVRIRDRHKLHRSLSAVNSMASARAGGISLLTSQLVPTPMSRSCELVTGTVVKGRRTVRSVRSGVSWTPRLTSSQWALLSCAGSGRRWIRSSLRRGDQVDIASSIQGGIPWAAVSGGSVLVKNGHAWHDPLGEHLPYPGRNAETFACVSRTGQQLTIGTIDGYTWQSAGVTYHQLTGYMLGLGGCWSGVVLDGGGSTTMVARLPGSQVANVQNVPAQNPARPVADTLVVFGR